MILLKQHFHLDFWGTNLQNFSEKIIKTLRKYSKTITELR